jgi:protoporphyrinogen oxidase
METFDYIIVGSGIAGLHTAYRLDQQGKKVLVLEKEPYVGGRMSTVDVDSYPLDWGAKFIANFYKNMLQLARELDIKPIPKVLSIFSIKREGKFYTVDISKKIAFIFWRGVSFKAKLRLALVVPYLWLKYRSLDWYNPESLLYLDDKSIQEDLRPLMGQEAFDYLVEPLIQNVVFYDTKGLSRAAFYSVFAKMLRIKTYSFLRGIGQLCEKLSAQLSVELGIQVKSVKRKAGGVEITAISKGKETVYHAKAAILAITGNHVLDVLSNPLPKEKEFFSKVQYAGTVQIIGTTKTSPFSNGNFIWTVPKENPYFSSFSFRPERSTKNEIGFHIALKERVYKQLLLEGNFNNKYIESLIQKELPSLTEVRITGTQIWESATPIMYSGYITSVVSFLNRPDWNNGIYFCGDYMENPSTEGALTSSIKLLEKLNSMV